MSEWKEYRVKDIASLFGRIGFRGYTTQDMVEEGEGCITLSPSNMTEEGMNYSKCSFLSWDKYYESPEIQIHNEDILLVKTGSSYGKTSFVENLPLEATINPQILVIKEIKLNKKFLSYIFKSEQIQRQVKYSVVGSTIPTISQEKISLFDFPAPSVFEQSCIVTYLDTKTAAIDKRIALLEKKQEVYSRLRRSIINRAVTRGLTPDVPLKDSGVDWIGMIPEHWEVRRMKDVSYMYSGLTGKSGDDFRCEDESKTKPFIPFTNILNNTKVNPTQVNRVVMTGNEEQNVVKKDDLLFLMSSEDYESIAKSAVVEDEIGEVYLNSFCRGLRPTINGLCPSFLNYELQSSNNRDALRFEARGFTRINIKVDRITSHFVTLPPLPEQRVIASYLDDKCAKIDAAVANIGKQIDALKRLKRALINEVVTGKRKV